MKPIEQFEDEADDVLEVINMGGCCATVRLLQLRLFGAEQLHGLVKRKVSAVAADTTRDEDVVSVYRVKRACIDALENDWFCCLHYFKRVNVESGDGLTVHETLVFTNDTLRCWLVVACDPFINVGTVQKAQDAARSLLSLLQALGYPVADVSYFVYAPVSDGLPNTEMRKRLELTPVPVPAEELPYVMALHNCETGQRAVRGMLKTSVVRQGCDPPPGYVVKEGRTICPAR